MYSRNTAGKHTGIGHYAGDERYRLMIPERYSGVRFNKEQVPPPISKTENTPRNASPILRNNGGRSQKNDRTASGADPSEQSTFFLPPAFPEIDFQEETAEENIRQSMAADEDKKKAASDEKTNIPLPQKLRDFAERFTGEDLMLAALILLLYQDEHRQESNDIVTMLALLLAFR